MVVAVPLGVGIGLAVRLGIGVLVQVTVGHRPLAGGVGGFEVVVEVAVGLGVTAVTTCAKAVGAGAPAAAHILAALAAALELFELLSLPLSSRKRPWGRRVREAEEECAWHMKEAIALLAQRPR